MIESVILDIVLLVVLIGYAIFGYLNGFVHALFGFLGAIVGAVVAYFFVPIVANWVEDSTWRLLAVVSVAVLLMVAGHAGGVAIGDAVARNVKQRGLRVINRVLGAMTSVIATTLVISLLAAGLATFGIPVLSRALAGSSVVRVIGALTPDPVLGAINRLRTSLVHDGLPAITAALGGIVNPPTLPDIDTGSPALDAAAQSVVRITGNASACGQNQAGSGFVISDDRVVTNAHVVAGVEQPVVETPAGQVLTATIVYFDPETDLAVIAVPGLDSPALTLGDTAADGAKGVINGYPYGGPFVSSPAEVLSVDIASVANIYADSENLREVYALATTVIEGDSGGPLLDLNGQVIGVVFARSADTENLGYAMTMAELDPVAAEAADLTKQVVAGRCVRG